MSLVPKPINMTTGEPSWRWRRIAFFIVLIWCLWTVGGMVDRIDSALNYAIATGGLWLAAGLSLMYMGFATIQDLLAIFITKSGRPYAETISGTVETKTVETKTVKPDPTVPPEKFGSGQ